MQFSKRGGKFTKHVRCTNPETYLNPSTNRVEAMCGSSDAMAVYTQEDGTQDATCFSCGYFDKDPLGPASLDSPDHFHESGEAIGNVRSTLTMEQLSECPMRGIPSRHISAATAEFFGVKSILNGLDGQTPVAIVFPYYNGSNITGYKKRILESKIFSVIGSTKDCKLFGAHKFSSGKKLYITEGELDCLSLFQILKDLSGPGYKHLDPCVVSLPHGAQSAASALGNNREFLDKFEEIVLVFDQDEAGKAAVSSVCSFLDPSKIRIATFSEKDPNDMLLKGKSSELKWAVVSHANAYRPEGITTSRTLLTQALTPSQMGASWPWPTLTKLTYGRHPGIYGIGAGVGIGKTEFFHELIHHITSSERKPVGAFLLEEAPARTVKIIAGKSLNLPLHRPDVLSPTGAVEREISDLSSPTERLYLFDHKGQRDWSTIFSQAKYLAAVHGVRDIIIDPLTAIISHEENTDRALHGLMADMAVLAADPFNCTVYFSSHLNEPPRDRRPHEEGGRVHESQYAGSRAMIRFSNFIIALERNKQTPDLSERNTTTVRILKDRDYGLSTGETFEIFYNQSTGRYLEQNFDF